MAVIGLMLEVEDVYKYISSAILAKQCVLQSTRWHNLTVMVVLEMFTLVVIIPVSFFTAAVFVTLGKCRICR